MAAITIANLYSTGSELFLDSESFLNELDDEQTDITYGGKIIICPIKPLPTRPIPTRPIPIKTCLTRPFPIKTRPTPMPFPTFAR